MTVSIKAAVKRIKIYAFAVKGMSRRELATKAGLQPGATRFIHDDAWNPTLATLIALEKVIPSDWDFPETPEMFKRENIKTKESGA